MNSEMYSSGARFVPVVDLTPDDDDTNSHTSDIPLQFLASAHFPSEQHLHRSRSHKLEATPCKMFTVSNRYQIRSVRILGNDSIPLHTLRVYLQFSDLSEVFNWSNNEHEKLCTISANRLDVLCSIHTLARNSETHSYNVQMQVRQLEHEGDARFAQRQKELLSRFSQEANQALGDLRDTLVKNVRSEVWRRDEQVHGTPTELGLHALHSEDVTQQQNHDDAGQHQHLIGLGQETQQYRYI